MNMTASLIKNADEIVRMRVAGRLAADVLEEITPHVQAGVSTDELNERCHDYIVNVQNAVPAPLNYRGFPKSICTSVNHVVCHGIPDGRKLRDGDIINIDVTVIKDGYHGDTSRMFYIGQVPARARRLVEDCYRSLCLAIDQVRPGMDLDELGGVIQDYAEQRRYSIVREFCGHGIGRGFHEEPHVLHYRPDVSSGVTLQAGMTFTIEPMINLGKRHVRILDDQWTVVTDDRSLSAQWEHTILVTESGSEVLTRRRDEEF